MDGQFTGLRSNAMQLLAVPLLLLTFVACAGCDPEPVATESSSDDSLVLGLVVEPLPVAPVVANVNPHEVLIRSASDRMHTLTHPNEVPIGDGTAIVKWTYTGSAKIGYPSNMLIKAEVMVGRDELMKVAAQEWEKNKYKPPVPASDVAELVGLSYDQLEGARQYGEWTIQTGVNQYVDENEIPHVDCLITFRVLPDGARKEPAEK